MIMICRLLPLLLAFAMPACIPVAGDGSVVVRGTAVDGNGNRFEDCMITLHDAGGSILRARLIKGDFREDFVIEPRSREYYVEVACVGAISIATSIKFRAGTSNLASPVKPCSLAI